jgi:hypothetical protein
VSLDLSFFERLGPIPSYPGAACVGLDPETWFQDDPNLARIAKSYCKLCKYGPKGDDSCYTNAMIEEEATGYFAFGIRGGRDAARRQRILDRKRMRAQEGIEEPENEWEQ